MQHFEIAGVPVGPDHPPIVLPDIGTFFNQDFALAESMIKSVSAAGCKFLKGEILHRADICLDDDTKETYYGVKTGLVSERYRELVERKVVPLNVVKDQMALARSLKLDVVLSVYDIEGADFAAQQGAVAIKAASSNIAHEPLIRYIAALKLPMIIDTGKSTMEEIARAVQWARDAGAERLIVEHSPDAPPAPVAQHHLRMLKTLAQVFSCPVGLSDHHAGSEMMIAGAALGASILEKGVCPDGVPVDQDVTHALPLSQLSDLRVMCQNVHAALGSPMRTLKRDRAKPAARMGLVARCDLAAGDVISLATVDFAFPAKGIETEHWSIVDGWTVSGEIKAGTPIRWNDVRRLAP